MNNSIKILFVLLLAFGVVSCKKEELYDPYAQLEKEAPMLKEYVEKTVGLEGALLHESTGIWYKIIEEGVKPEFDNDEKPVDNGYYAYNINNVPEVERAHLTVKYTGRLVATGEVFDKNRLADGDVLTVGGVIQGMNIAFLPKVLIKEVEDKDDIKLEIGLTELGLQKGSKIRIVIPSPYAYANNPPGGLPVHAILDFELEVMEVKPPPAPKPVQ